MSEKTNRELLAESVEHWRRLATGQRNKGEIIGPADCALCLRYNTHNTYEQGTSCQGCPVFARTGQIGCEGTPWVDIDEAVGAGAFKDLDWLDSDKFKAMANAELKYLEALLAAEGDL